MLQFKFALIENLVVDEVAGLYVAEACGHQVLIYLKLFFPAELLSMTTI